MRKRYSEEDILHWLRKAKDELGYFPTVEVYKEWAKEHQAPSYDVILRHTGRSYEYYKEKLGVPIKPKQTKERVISALKEAAEIYGEDIRRREYQEWYRQNRIERPSTEDLGKVFHSFNRAKLAAGLIPNQSFFTIEATPEECVAALQACERDIGEGFSAADYDRWRKGTSYPSFVTVRKKLGDYRIALKRAGLNPDAHKIPAERFYQDVYAYMREKLKPICYEKWAKEFGRLVPVQFGPNGVYFNEILIQVLEKVLEEQRIVENQARRSERGSFS